MFAGPAAALPVKLAEKGLAFCASDALPYPMFMHTVCMSGRETGFSRVDYRRIRDADWDSFDLGIGDMPIGILPIASGDGGRHWRPSGHRGGV